MKKSISDAIKALAVEWYDSATYTLERARDINGGDCDNFANAIVAKFPGAEAVWDDELTETGETFGGHCVIKYEGRYYDSECPEGVEDWEDIPFFIRHAVEYSRTTAKLWLAGLRSHM